MAAKVNPKISYLLPCYRAFYTSRLLGEIAKKTTLPYEFLLWLNLDDAGLEAYIESLINAGFPIRIVGKTPENIGMMAFKPLIEQAKGELLVQLEDDVLYVSRRAGEIATNIFKKRPDIWMLSAALWQDEFSDGGHPRPDKYVCVSKEDKLYEGPIDGGFSVYPRVAVPALLQSQFRKYFGMGAEMHCRVNIMKKKAYECHAMKIFHLCGPVYHSLFAGMVEFEIEKYRKVGHEGMVKVFKEQVKMLPPKSVLTQRLRMIEHYHESFSG